MKTFLSVWGAVCLAPVFAFGADYQGAEAVLKQVAGPPPAAKSSTAGAAGSPTPAEARRAVGTVLWDMVDLLMTPSPKAPAPADKAGRLKLQSDLKAFHEKGATLDPEEAAKEWLDLAERFGKLSQGEDDYSDGAEVLSFESIVTCLPPPKAWNALAKAAEALPEGVGAGGAQGFRGLLLRTMAHWLTGDKAAQEKDAAALDASIAKLPEATRKDLLQMSHQLRSALLESSDDGEAVLKALNETLDSDIAAGAAQARNRGFGNPGYGNPGFSNPRVGSVDLQVPDLVSLVGEKKAAEFLRRAIGSKGVRLSPVEGEETEALARKLALEMVADMKTPQWVLAQSLNSTALYEAMATRFPETKGGYRYQNGDRNTAQTYYLLGLIAAHRTKDAAAVALSLGGEARNSLPEEALAELERAGLTEDLTRFFHDVLAKNPDLPFWEEYVQLAAKTGETDEMVALAEASAARKNLTDAQRLAIQKHLRHAYLAADKVEKGIGVLREEIASQKKQAADAGKEEGYDFSSAGLDLAQVGAVLGREDLTTEGVQAARDSLRTKSKNSQHYGWRQLAVFFVENGRGAEAEAMLAEGLASLGGLQPNESFDSSAGRELLVLLMDVYDGAHRPADVVALLDHAPQWGAKDLAEVYKETASTNNNEDYAGYFAAAALAEVGRKEEARKINDAVLDQEGGCDPAIELMVKLAPDEAIARLDALFARDKFQSRPVIWKAKVLLGQGKLEEAEAAARQAVSIDPSDGESGRGRRMRVYSVLADIREARGDAKEAALFRGAVTAIRHSEDADRFYEAGLITRAVKMYEEALTHFSDAYCIQSRLALRLAELGDMAGAEEHYRRAYELMPDSFGRVESHCFGCERAFAGHRAQSIAEKVFTELAAKRPEKAQVHYLLGYLRFEEDRFRDALPEFREAVKLDPEYLNAWKKLGEVGEKARLPAAERDAIQLNILRLDPLGRHSSFEGKDVTDLRAAWDAVETAAKAQTPAPTELYPLAASAAEIAKAEKNAAAAGRGSSNFYSSGSGFNGREEVTPGKMISEHQVVQRLGGLFGESDSLFAQ